MGFGGNPRNLFGGALGGALLLGGGMVLVNSLFNVDGGHRAIKYTRIGGVQKEIYAEGSELSPGLNFHMATDVDRSSRHSFSHTLVRDSDYIRCARQTTQCCLLDRHQRFANGEHNLSCPLSTPGRRPPSDLSHPGYRL